MSEGHGAVMPVGVFLALGQGSDAAHVARDTGETFFRELAVVRFKLDAEVTAFEESGRDESAAGTCKGVEDNVAGGERKFQRAGLRR